MRPTSCVDQVLAGDLAPVGPDPPFAAGAARDAGDLGVAVDLRAAVARALGHGVGRLAGIDEAVVGLVNRADQAVELDQGVDLLELGGAEDIEAEAGVFAEAAHVAELVHPVLAACDAQGTAAMEADRAAGLLLERARIELHAVRAQRLDGEVVGEVGAEASGVPGRAGGQFVLLDQHHVAPAELDQVVEQRHAHGATADDHDAGMAFHGMSPGVPRMRRPSGS
jgi:hypothetical protein